jgi:prepilin-type N-terminal cleavage/methylation domain-containing protein
VKKKTTPLSCFRPAGDSGFTLLEIMLAALVLAMVVTMVSMSLSGSIRAIDATRAQGEIYYRAQVALERIADDLRTAVLPPDVDFVGNGGGDEGEEGVLLSFAGMSHIVFDPDNGQPGMGIIGYALQPDREDDGQLVLLRSDRLYRPGLDATPDRGEVEAFVLCDRLRSVGFSFLGPDGEAGENWDTRIKDGQEDAGRHLPVAVTCRLEFWLDREAETSIVFETTVTLPVGLVQPAEENGNGA